MRLTIKSLLLITVLYSNLYTATITDFTCANPKTFEAIYSANDFQKMLLIGNTSLCANDGSGNCEDPGTSPNNSIDMMHNDYDDVNGTSGNASTILNSSAAYLNVPAGKKVLYAGLFWQGYMVNFTNANKVLGQSIKYKHHDSSSYELSTDGSMNWVYFNDERMYYQSYLDITAYVNANGGGYYWVGDIATTEGTPNGGGFGAWAMTVVYEDDDEDFNNVTLFHGYQAFAGGTDINNAITYANNNGCSNTNTGVGTNVSSTLSGFLTPKENTVDSTLAVFAGEGDIDLVDDSGSITDKDGTAHPLHDALNPASNIMNATISNYGTTVTTGIPYYSPNTLGVDIDLYDVSSVIENDQSTTNITLTSSGDGYMPGMYALQTKIYIPQFCYDYAYKQNSVDFTEENDGTKDPELVGNVTTGDDVEIKLFLKNMETDLSATNVSIDILDINTSQVIYDTSIDGIRVANVGEVYPVTQLNSNLSITTSGGQTSIEGIPLNDINVGDYFYLYYNLSPQITTLDTPMNIVLNYDLLVGGVNTRYKTVFGEKISMCKNTANNYEPANGIFNIVHDSYYNNTTTYYNLPTQVTKRVGNFKAISLDYPDNPDTLKVQTTIASVEMIDVNGFHYTDASCTELENIISDKVWIIFDNVDTMPLNNTVINSNFYSIARENAAFRVSFALDYNDSIQSLEYTNGTNKNDGWNLIDAPNFSPDVCSNNSANTISSTCVNGMNDAALKACMECIYGLKTKLVCSKDNFSIRPEAFLIKLNDQNQTNPSSSLRLFDNVSGVNTPDASTTLNHIASGYQYNLEVNATNHLDNRSSVGYIKAFGSSASDVIEYLWNPGGTLVSGCNDITSKQLSFQIYNGYLDVNTSLSEVGLYKLHIEDTTWTTVDYNPIYMGHHGTSDSTYFLSENTPDCAINTALTQAVNSNTLNGCNISSNHDSSYLLNPLKYRDYNLQFHPYKFNMSGISPSIGANNIAVGANSFIYMADMSQDQNMSYHLIGNINAQGYDNSVLSNFVDACYVQPISLTINKTAISGAVAHQYRFNNTDIPANSQNADINTTIGVINLNANDFNKSNNGVVNTGLYMNFNRDKTAAMNPESITFSTYTSECTTPANCRMNADLTSINTDGNITLNNTLSHFYAKAHASRQRYELINNGDLQNANIYYQIFCHGSINGNTCKPALLPSTNRTDDIRWYVNTAHNINNDGNVSSVVQVGGSMITNDVVDTTNLVNANPTTVNLSYDASKGYPYKTTMEINASNWLIYNKYDPAAFVNEFPVEFEKAGTSWSGEHETNTTTVNTGTIKTNRRSMW